MNPGIAGKTARIEPTSEPTKTAPNRWWNTVSEPRRSHHLNDQEAR